MTDSTSSVSPALERPDFDSLPPAAQRALREAAERRQAADAARAAQGPAPKEVNGRGGAEPVRYGDWEVSGIATDF
jgi:hypothetical protein